MEQRVGRKNGAAAKRYTAAMTVECADAVTKAADVSRWRRCHTRIVTLASTG